MKVLVTGGAGFIGSHTVDFLIASGSEVVIVDNLSTGKRENLNSNATYYEMGIESKQLAQVFEQNKPDYVIHLAAQVSVARSIQDPIADCLTNVFGCVNVLDCCQKFNVKKVVYASSAAVYGNPSESVLTEQMKTLPLSFYGISKLTPESYLQVYNALFGLKYTIFRYANVYGPRQDALGEGGVVSLFADRLSSGVRPTIHGDGEQSRDFVYVEDVARANIMALSEADEKTLNLGTGLPTSINQLFQEMKTISGVDLEPNHIEARVGDIRHSCMNISEITSSLGWRPQISLREGLERTLSFYKKS